MAVQAVNSELYQLRQLAEPYKLQQRQLELAYLTIDSSLESLAGADGTARPAGTRVQPNGGGRPGRPDAAAPGRPALAASGPEPLLTIWINYLDQRLATVSATWN